MMTALPPLDRPDLVKNFLAPHLVQGNISHRAGRVWTVLTSPFNVIAFIVLQMLSHLTHQLCMKRATYVLRVLSFQMLRNQILLYSEWAQGDRMVAPTFFRSQLGWHLWALPADRLYTELEAESIREATFAERDVQEAIDQEMKQFFQTLNKGRYLPFGWAEGGVQSKLIAEFSRRYRQDSSVGALKWLKKRFAGTPNLSEAIGALYIGLETRRKNRWAYGCQTVTFVPPAGGLCRGAGLWFIALLKKNTGRYDTVENALKAVATEFEAGTPPQGLFLHAFYTLEDFLGLKIERCPNQLITAFDLDWDHEEARGKVAALKPGIYQVGCKQHSLVYIKVDGKRDFLWDNNMGVLKSSETHFLNHVSNEYHVSGDCTSMIYFRRCT